MRKGLCKTYEWAIIAPRIVLRDWFGTRIRNVMSENRLRSHDKIWIQLGTRKTSTTCLAHRY